MEQPNEPIEIKLTPLQKWRLKNPDYIKNYYENVRKPKLQGDNVKTQNKT